MTLNKVQQLAVELFDKLRQYKDGQGRTLLKARNEAIFAQAQSLLSESATSWSLTPSETTYYILSGYAHTTFQAISYIGDDSDDTPTDEQEIEEEGEE